MCNYHTLVDSLHGFAERAQGGHLTLGDAIDTLDEAAYAFIAIILVLPFLQPVPLGPLTVIGGVTFAALGWQLMRGNESPIVPEKIRQVALSEHHWRIIVNVCLKVMGFCRKFSKPRYTHLVRGRLGQKIGGFILLAGGALMAIPFGVLPLNNFLPGLAILFYGIGELEEDGLMVFIAFFWLAVTVIYFSVFFVMLWMFGKEALHFFGG
jgi:hypothetical protein